MAVPCEAVGEVDPEVLVLRGEGDGEAAEGEGLVQGGVGLLTESEHHQLRLAEPKRMREARHQALRWAMAVLSWTRYWASKKAAEGSGLVG